MFINVKTSEAEIILISLHCLGWFW